MASTGRKNIVFCVTVVFIDKLHRTRQLWQVENEQYLPRDDHVTQRQREAGPTYKNWTKNIIIISYEQICMVGVGLGTFWHRVICLVLTRMSEIAPASFKIHPATSTPRHRLTSNLDGQPHVCTLPHTCVHTRADCVSLSVFKRYLCRAHPLKRPW